jgi:UMF1 family MFS transporter
MKFDKTQRSWAMYDWANSVYSLVISTVLFPIYYETVTTNETMDVVFLGSTWQNTVIYSYVISASFLTVALLSPYLAAMADRTGRRKVFMRSFMIVGALSTAFMSLFTAHNPALGLVLAYFASLGFSGSIVFYNSYLPIVAPVEMQDRLSARGFSLGYLGSSLLLILLLVLIQMPEVFGLPDAGVATRLAFAITGIWWLGFGLPVIARLPKDEVKDYFEGKLFWKSWSELISVFQDFRKVKSLRIFLGAFFWYSAGIQSTILLAAVFGKKVIGMESGELILLILIMQFVAIAGSLVFARISERTTNVYALKIGVSIWVVVALGAYLCQTSLHFMMIGGLTGFVLGAVQSLSRSTYSKMLPETEDHSTYFSFYDVMEKLATTLGAAAFGVMEAWTGNLRNAALSLVLFFLIGLVQLFRLRRIEKKATA